MIAQGHYCQAVTIVVGPCLEQRDGERWDFAEAGRQHRARSAASHHEDMPGRLVHRDPPLKLLRLRAGVRGGAVCIALYYLIIRRALGDDNNKIENSVVAIGRRSTRADSAF